MASMARNANMVSLKYEQKVAIHTSIPIFSWFRTFFGLVEHATNPTGKMGRL